MRAHNWLIEDFVDMQRQLVKHGKFTSDEPELRAQHRENVAIHGTALDNGAVRMVQLTLRYPQLKSTIGELNDGRKVIEEQFLEPWIEYFSSLDELGDSPSKSDVDEVHGRYGKPLAYGVDASRQVFEQLWPKLAAAHDQVWQLKGA